MLIFAAMALILSPAGACAQPWSASVFDSTSGGPISEAAITLAGPGGLVHEAETDSDGCAAFPGLRPGRYLIRVEKPGYVDLFDLHGRGRPIEFHVAGEPVSAGLSRAVAITGQVADFRGRPLQGAKVMAIARRYSDGGYRLTPVGEAARTDDRGHYRLYGLPAGHYSVAAVPAGDGVFAPAFCGSDDTGEALFFKTRPGETRESVNLRVAGIEAPSISGKVSGMPVEAGPHRAALMLVTQGGLRVPIAARVTDEDGAFVMSQAPPGEHRLLAWAPFSGWDSNSPPEGRNARAISRAVTVSAGDLQIDVKLQPLASVSGRVVQDGVQDAGACGGARVVFRPEDAWVDEWAPAAALIADSFTIDGLPVGRYRIQMPGLAGSCRLAAVRVGGQLAPGGIASVDGSAPITLVLSTATGEISGTARNEEGKPAAGFVLLAPQESEDSVRVGQIDSQGRYRFGDVPVGQYRLIALTGLNSMDYLDPVAAADLGARVLMVEAGRELKLELRLVQK